MIAGRAGVGRREQPQRLLDGRVRPGDFGLVGEPARAPAGAPAQRADPLGLPGGHPVRRALRAAGALLQAGQRPAVLRRSGPPAAHPLPDGRLRDVRPGGRLGERLAFLNDTTCDLPPSKVWRALWCGTPGLLEGRELTPTPSWQARTYLSRV